MKRAGWTITTNGQCIHFDVDMPENRLEGCSCELLDEMGLCHSDKGCPSASHAHILLEIPGKPGTFEKFCPVLMADCTGAFVLDPDGGIAGMTLAIPTT